MDCCITEQSDLSIKSYAEFMASQGEIVLDIKGISWVKYYGALIPAAPIPVYIDLTNDEATQLINKSDAIFIRYTTNSVKTSGDWWDIVCRDYNFNNLSSNTRSKIRRGTRRLKIEQVSPDLLKKQGYECHVKCYQRYKYASPKNRKDYQYFINSLSGQPIFDIWACSKNGELLGYIICMVEKNGVFMHTVDITPSALHEYAAYAMIHHILEYYVNKKGLPVSNGSRSILHETNMQDFLSKLGFQREYAELHIVYRPDINIIVNLLYPFRRILKVFNRIPFLYKVSSVLFQEEIIRRQKISKSGL